MPYMSNRPRTEQYTLRAGYLYQLDTDDYQPHHPNDEPSGVAFLFPAGPAIYTQGKWESVGPRGDLYTNEAYSTNV